MAGESKSVGSGTTAAVLMAAVALLLGVLSAPAQAAPGDIYLGDSSLHRVLKTGPGGGTPVPVSTDPDLVAPNSLEFAPDGRLLVIDYDAFAGAGGVLAIDRTTGAATPVRGGAPFEQPDGATLGPGNTLYVTDLDGTPTDGVLFRLDLDTNDVAPVTSGGNLTDALGVAVDPTSGRIFADGYGGTKLIEVDPATGAQSVLSNGPASSPFADLRGLVRLPSGLLYVHDATNNKLYEVNPDTRSSRVVAENLGAAAESYDMTYDLDGNLIIAGGFGPTLRVDPRTGASTTVTPASPTTYVEGVGVEPPLCAGKVPTIVGTNQAEQIKGSPVADVIAGQGGRDKISALAGNDVVCGGKGKDRINGGKGKDRLIGGKGRDIVNGGKGNDRCVGDAAGQRSC